MTIDLADENFALLSEEVARRGVSDEAGNLQFAEGVDSGEDDPTLTGAGRSLSSFINRGLRNADFWDGPLLGAGSIIDDTNNPMPGWSVPCTEQTVATWITGAYPSGRNVRFTGTGSGRFSQWIYVGSDALEVDRLRFVVEAVSSAASGTFELTLFYLDRDLNSLGSSSPGAHSLTASLRRYVDDVTIPEPNTAWVRVQMIFLLLDAGQTVDVVTTRLLTTPVVQFPQFVGCVVVPTLEATVTATPEIIDWDDTDEYDSHGFHDPASSPSRITIPVGMDGYYVFSCMPSWAANGTGDRTVTFLKNGGGAGYIFNHRAATAGINTKFYCETAPMLLVAGDYIEVQVNQDSGGNLNFRADSRFWCKRVA